MGFGGYESFIELSFKSWSYFDARPRAAGDIDGDGLCDVVGFNRNGLYVAFAKPD